MTGKLRDLTVNRDGTQNVTITVSDDITTLYDSLKDQTIAVEIKKAGKRSKDANAMCWAVCSAIGNALTPPVDKEEVYRRAIRAVGVFTPVSVLAWDVPKIKQRWSSHGVGWFVDVVDDAGTGRKLINLYYGSSTYTVSEMRVLIEWLMDEARQMQIAIPLGEKEAERLLERWGKECHRHGK